MVRKFWPVLALICLSFSSLAAQKQSVFLYTYHNKPPFIVDIDSEVGLYYDLAELLNEESDNYNFIVAYLPRNRINTLIDDENLNGVVVGVVPAWFKDKDKEKYLWLSSFYDDKDEFISRKDSTFEFYDKTSFTDKVFAGVSGYYYFGLNESVSDGSLVRIDASAESQVLKLVELKRANFGIVSESVLKYLNKTGQLKDIYHLSTIPHDTFSRAAFVMRDNLAFYNYLQRIFVALPSNPDWQAILNKYE